MKALIQRVNSASVFINDKEFSNIKKGLLIFLGVNNKDNEVDVDLLVNKIVNLRIFQDENDKINFSLLDLSLPVMVVSQYSLYAQYKKGKRPSFTDNANLEDAKRLYDLFCDNIAKFVDIKTGVFRENMQINLVNDGPFTMILESEDLK